MSTVSSGYGNQNQQITNFDLSKIFVFNNRYQNDNELNNSTYNPLVLSAGTVMGRVVATGNVAPLDTNASDGSQLPVGILAQDVSLVAGASQTVSICDDGDVAQEKIIFYYQNQGLDTAVSGIRMRDRLKAQGIKIVPGFEMTILDNQ